LAQFISPSNIFDRLVEIVGDTPRVAEFPGASGLAVSGFRLRIKGRPKGEEMAVRHDFLHGSCPKQDPEALIDFGKHGVLLRSGMVGVKAWVHFQRPNREDETGKVDLLHNLFESKDVSMNRQKKKTDDFPSLLGVDRDYDPVDLPMYADGSNGLWNVTSSSDPEVSALVQKLKSLHEPDHPDVSRFIW
jgi:hypothetical protein